jgi:outer membrane immunogenic protein
MNRCMIKSLLGGVSSAALSCSAFAADMAVKAPPPAPAPSYSWTGFYGGLHAGGGWFDDPNSIVTTQDLTGAAPAHPLQTANLKSSAFPFGGVQVGYNWKLQERWVVGLETDFSGLATGGNVTLVSGPITDTVNTRDLNWFGTVRGRLGYLYTPAVLTYVTGGLAYGNSQKEFDQAIVGPGPVGVFRIPGSSRTRTGWTMGGGVEYALDAKWSVKVEYDYLRFDDGMASSNTIHFTPGKGVTGIFNVSAPNYGAHTVQLGLNYHFWN